MKKLVLGVLLSNTVGCGLISNWLNPRTQADSEPESVNLLQLTQDLGMTSGHTEVLQTVQNCPVHNWAKAQITFPTNIFWQLPKTIVRSVGPAESTKILLSGVTKADKSTPAGTFECTYSRPTAAYGKRPENYTLDSCTVSKKKQNFIRASELKIIIGQDGIPTINKDYTFGPIKAQVGCLNLPKDPGLAGEKTLLGIDADNDGVRDDIQR